MVRNEAWGPGSRNGGPFGTDPIEPIDAFEDEGPIDIAAVRHDDALIDAIAGNGPVATDNPDEYQLAMLLASWRAELTSAPLPAGPDLDTVVAAVNMELAAVATERTGRRRLRLLGPVTAAASVIAVVAGLTAISYNANPGDALWSVKEAVFSQQAESTMARIDSSTDLDAAEQAMAQGDVDGAISLLERAANRANKVDNSEHRQDLQARANSLRNQLEQAGGAATSLIPPWPPLLPPVTSLPILPPLLPGTSAAVPPATNQLVPDTTSSTAVAPVLPSEELPLLPPTDESPTTVNPDQTQPPVEPTTPFEPTNPTGPNPPASDTITLVPPPVVEIPPASNTGPPPVEVVPPGELQPMTTIKSEPEVIPMPGVLQPAQSGFKSGIAGGF